MSTKFTPIVALFAALALVTAGVALAAAVTVKSRSNATLGKVVVNSSGKTLYHNSKEKKGLIKCTGACAVTWPPLLVAKNAKLQAGPGIKVSKLGKIKRPGGHYQVTYYGKPLYRYAGDHKAGNVNGEGLGGIWFALKTNGAPAKTTSTSTTTTTTTTTSTTGY